MPRPAQSTGRAGTPVIPENWEAAHAIVAARAMRGEVELRHAGTAQTWSETDEQMIAVPTDPYFTGPARVQALTAQARRIVTADDAELEVDYLIAVPLLLADDAREGDVVTVTGSHDAALSGRTLLVRIVEVGTERFERDLFCSLTA